MFRKMMLAAVAIVALTAAPAAAQYGGGDLVLSDSQVRPGDSIELVCAGLEPNIPYEVTFGGEVVGGGITDDDGVAAGTLTIASDTPPGVYTVAITAGDGGCSAEIEVLGDDATQPPGGTQPPPVDTGFTPGTGTGTGTGPGIGAGELARTGSSDSLRVVAMVGAGLLAAGGIAMLSMRRRTA